jgi:hypothetical protein
MMGFGNNTHVRNGSTCKEKWATIYGDYKRIQDYMGSQVKMNIFGTCLLQIDWHPIYLGCSTKTYLR